MGRLDRYVAGPLTNILCSRTTKRVVRLAFLALLTSIWYSLMSVPKYRYDTVTRQDVVPLGQSCLHDELVHCNFKCGIGSPPWTRLDLMAELTSFRAVFDARPGFENDGGSSFMHYFALWCIVRSIKPRVIIESGIHAGVGSWFLRQAAGRNVRMIFISPEAPGVYKDKELTSEYYVDSRFRDFSKIDWNMVMPSLRIRSKSLVFFDDHQAGVRRLQEARKLGFKHVVFDDNYLPGLGDNFSPKMVCNPATYDLFNASFRFLDDFGKINYKMTMQMFQKELGNFTKAVRVYAEFPPIWSGPNRFGIPDDIFKKVTMPPLFQTNDILSLLAPIDLESEARRYTHIVYLKIDT